ncbi:MAG: BTAD domain-containing putative transcriptional regulator [Actinomycetota bacterium]
MPRQPGANRTGSLLSDPVWGGEADEILRTRLLERLADRWTVPLTVIRGSAGAGKSTLLRQARDQNEADPRGIELHLTLREGDADASRLASRLSSALGLDGPNAASDHPALDIIDEVAARSPAAMCLHLDDAHRVDASSTGGELLRRLVDERPSNLTFVVATRNDLPIPLARRAATGQLVLIDGDDELFFDAAELASLGRDQDDRGWPVLIALDAANRPGVRAGDFLLEEVASELDPAQRSALELLAGAGRLPTSVVESRFGDGTAQALTELPLIERADDDLLVAHDLWADAMSGRVADVSALIDVLLADQHFDRALGLAGEEADPAMTERVLLAAAIHHAPAFPADTARRWLDALDPELRSRDAAQLIEIAAALRTDAGVLDTLDELAQRWSAADAPQAHLALLAIGANRAYSAGRLDRVLEIRGELDQLQPPLPAFLEAVRAGVDAVLADLTGQAEAAIEHLATVDFDAVPPLLAEQLVRLLATNHVALGRSAEVVSVVERRLAQARSQHIALTPLALRWFSGEPGPIRAIEGAPPASGLLGPDLVINRCFRTHFSAAYFLRTIDGGYADDVLAAAGDIPRLRVMALIARAAATVVAGDEHAAAAALAGDLAGFDLGDPVVELELWRFMAIAAVLVPGAVDLDAAGESGPTHRRMAELVRLFLDGRTTGAQLAAARCPTATDLTTTFPLPWTVEFVVRARQHGAGWATDLAAEVLDEVGADAREAMISLAATGGAAGEAAQTLLDETPQPPAESLQVQVLGPFRLLRDGREVDDQLLRRARVRQLISLLVTTDGLRRDDLIDRLWPDASPTSGAKNLRTNLSHVRRVLEPSITSRAPSYYVRASGDRIRLGGTSLRSDLADFEHHLGEATVADDLGDLATALAGYEQASELWRGTPFTDLDDVEGMDAMRASLQRRATFAATRAAEIRLARNDLIESMALAERSLVISPYSEPAHRIRLAALVAGSDLAGVQTAIDELESCRDEGLIAVDAETTMVLRRARDLIDRSGHVQDHRAGV